MDFCRKGNEEQFIFNAGVGDRIEAVAKKVKRSTRRTTRRWRFFRMCWMSWKSLIERQKHIHIMDQVKHSWKVVEAYRWAGIGNNEEDNKRIKLADDKVDEEVAQEKKEMEEPSTTQQLPQQFSFPGYYGPQWPHLMGQVQPGTPPPPQPSMFQPGTASGEGWSMFQLLSVWPLQSSVP